MTKYKYHYYVSYNYSTFGGYNGFQSNGFGMCEFVFDTPLTKFEDLERESKNLKFNNNFSELTILNYYLLYKERI